MRACVLYLLFARTTLFGLPLALCCWCSCLSAGSVCCRTCIAGEAYIGGRGDVAASFIYRRRRGRCYAVQQAVKKPRERPQAFRWWNAVQDDRQPASTSVVRRRVEGLEDTASRSRFVCIITSDRLGQTTRPGTGRGRQPLASCKTKEMIAQP